ncbi:deoxycytidine triphosphate deaminase [Clostridium sp. C105KSO15]|nr:deoxycytidine triphosphate deaminase [Clostridium sp. C105KSO15]
MILTGNEINQAIRLNKLSIKPFSESCVNPNSYDISIGNKIFCYPDGIILDGVDGQSAIDMVIPNSGLILKGNKFYYAMSLEIICCDYYVPILHNRSGVARKGMFTHITADLQQLHHNGRILLQFLPFTDTIIYPMQKVAQISFWKPH